MSEALFQVFDSLDTGVTTVTWWYNDGSSSVSVLFLFLGATPTDETRGINLGLVCCSCGDSQRQLLLVQLQLGHLLLLQRKLLGLLLLLRQHLLGLQRPLPR